MNVGVLIGAIIMMAAQVVRADDSKDQKRQAKALMVQGAKDFDLGNFPEAIANFKKAYATYPYPESLYNLGQAYRMNHDYDKALFSYRLYLDKVPAAQDRKEILARIQELEDLSARQKAHADRPPDGNKPKASVAAPAVATPAAPVEPANEQPRWYTNRWAWLATGVGVLAVGVGLSFLAWSSSLDADAAEAHKALDGIQLRSSADDKRTLGMVTTLGGAVLCAGGVALFVWNPSHAVHKAVPIAVHLGLAAINVVGTF